MNSIKFISSFFLLTNPIFDPYFSPMVQKGDTSIMNRQYVAADKREFEKIRYDLLTPRQCDVIRLRVENGLRPGEIRKKLAIKISSVYSLYKGAVAKLARYKLQEAVNSLFIHGRQEITKKMQNSIDQVVAAARQEVMSMLPDSLATVDKAIRSFQKRPVLATKTSIEVLKGTQVLVPKSESFIDVDIDVLARRRADMQARFDAMRMFGMKVPIEAEVEVVDEKPDVSRETPD